MAELSVRRAEDLNKALTPAGIGGVYRLMRQVGELRLLSCPFPDSPGIFRLRQRGAGGRDSRCASSSGSAK